MAGVQMRFVDDFKARRRQARASFSRIVCSTDIRSLLTVLCQRLSTLASVSKSGAGDLCALLLMPILTGNETRLKILRLRPRETAHDERVDQHEPICQWRGCQSAGEHRAPKGRGREGQYYFLCLAHVREFNASYNYFEGMSNTDIEAYQKDSVIGHRPTWRAGANAWAHGTRYGLDAKAGSSLKQRMTPMRFSCGAPTRVRPHQTPVAAGSSPWN